MHWAITGSGNGLSPVRRQAITWTNTGLLSIGPMRTNFSEIWNLNSIIFIQENAFEEWLQFCSGSDEINYAIIIPILAGRLFGIKPLSEPMPPYCQLNHQGQISVTFQSTKRYFIEKKMNLNMLSAQWRPFCLDLNLLKTIQYVPLFPTTFSVATVLHILFKNDENKKWIDILICFFSFFWFVL